MPFQSKGGGGIEGGLRRHMDRVALVAPEALLRDALILEGGIKQILLTPGTGRIYKRGKNITHQASAPGDPPAPDQGTLMRSITHDVTSTPRGGRGRLGSGIAAAMRVGTNEESAEALELGTTNAGKNHDVVILPRPYMRPGEAATRDERRATVISTLREGTRGN